MSERVRSAGVPARMPSQTLAGSASVRSAGVPARTAPPPCSDSEQCPPGRAGVPARPPAGGPSRLQEIKGWHGRGYLPHYDGGEVPQSVTFRLEDSLPQSRLVEWKQELELLPPDKREAEYRERIESYLDRGEGSAWLAQPPVAEMVEAAIRFFDGERYTLIAWVVMPNHVHALLEPGSSRSLSSIAHSWKTFTARNANALLGLSGRFWQPDYFDRFVRDDLQLSTTIEYIEQNPVKAGLCARAEDWPFGSARFRAGAEEEA